MERQRVEAQDELSRNREKLRRLSQTLAVEHALEDGRRAGFEEGLKQGRVYQQATSASWMICTMYPPGKGVPGTQRPIRALRFLRIPILGKVHLLVLQVPREKSECFMA